MALDLILVRHGQSQYNVDQTGGENAPLTELGRMQARRVGAYLAARFEVEALYASPLIRAHETAQIINTFLGLDLLLEPDLREEEQNFLAEQELFSDPVASFRRRPPYAPAEVSEYYAEYQARVQRGMEKILSAYERGQIALVSHGGTIGTIIRSLTGGHQFTVHTENTGIHLLHWEECRWHIVAMNRVEHLMGQQDLISIPSTHEQRRE